MCKLHVARQSGHLQSWSTLWEELCDQWACQAALVLLAHRARLWTQEQRDFNSDLIYEHTKGSTRGLLVGPVQTEGRCGWVFEGAGSHWLWGRESGWQVSLKALKNGAGIRGYEGRGAWGSLSLLPLLPRDEQGLGTICLRCGAKGSQERAQARGKLRLGGRWVGRMGRTRKRASTLSQLSHSSAQVCIAPLKTLGPLSLHAGETVLNQGAIQPHLQAGREATALGDEGQRIKALRRGTQQFHPAGHFPPVTSMRGCWPGSHFEGGVAFGIINRISRALGRIAWVCMCVYVGGGWLKSDVTLCEPKRRSVTAVIVA